MKIFLLIIAILFVVVMVMPKDTNPLCAEMRRLKDNPREQVRWEAFKVSQPESVEECQSRL